MPQVPTTSDNKVSTASKNRPPLVPPEEDMWKRYSPHHEFSLSGAASLTLHIIAIVIIGFLIVNWLPEKDKNKDVPQMEPVTVAGNEDVLKPVKGGGGKGGKDDQSQQGEETGDEEGGAAKEDKEDDMGGSANLEDPKEAPVVKVPSRKGGTRTIVQGNVPDALDQLGKKAYTVLSNAQGKRKAKRSRGSGDGEGGGQDKGKGKGKGDLEEKRAQRQVRWQLTLNYDVNNGADVRDKLKALGAILVVAEYQRDANGRVLLDNRGQARLRYRLVIRNISSKSQPHPEDVSKIDRIFWIYDKRPAVVALAEALGLRQAPPLFACFFPERVEKKLLELEREKYQGPESNIEKTYFEARGRSGVDDLVCRRVELKSR